MLRFDDVTKSIRRWWWLLLAASWCDARPTSRTRLVHLLMPCIKKRIAIRKLLGTRSSCQLHYYTKQEHIRAAAATTPFYIIIQERKVVVCYFGPPIFFLSLRKRQHFADAVPEMVYYTALWLQPLLATSGFPPLVKCITSSFMWLHVLIESKWIYREERGE